MSPTTTYGPGALDTLLTMTPEQIDQLPWRPVPGCPGVTAKDLLHSDHLHDALISYEPGAGTPGRPHPAAHHHIWVVSGSASVAGHRVVAGSYVYVPPAAAHPVDSVGAEGCLLLQMHRPLSTEPAP